MNPAAKAAQWGSVEHRRLQEQQLDDDVSVQLRFRRGVDGFVRGHVECTSDRALSSLHRCFTTRTAAVAVGRVVGGCRAPGERCHDVSVRRTAVERAAGCRLATACLAKAP